MIALELCDIRIPEQFGARFERGCELIGCKHAEIHRFGAEYDRGWVEGDLVHDKQMVFMAANDVALENETVDELGHERGNPDFLECFAMEGSELGFAGLNVPADRAHILSGVLAVGGLAYENDIAIGGAHVGNHGAMQPAVDVGFPLGDRADNAVFGVDVVDNFIWHGHIIAHGVCSGA